MHDRLYHWMINGGMLLLRQCLVLLMFLWNRVKHFDTTEIFFDSYSWVPKRLLHLIQALWVISSHNNVNISKFRPHGAWFLEVKIYHMLWYVIGQYRRRTSVGCMFMWASSFPLGFVITCYICIRCTFDLNLRW